jgi:hypothetical protein
MVVNSLYFSSVKNRFVELIQKSEPVIFDSFFHKPIISRKNSSAAKCSIKSYIVTQILRKIVCSSLKLSRTQILGI